MRIIQNATIVLFLFLAACNSNDQSDVSTTPQKSLKEQDLSTNQKSALKVDEIGFVTSVPDQQLGVVDQKISEGTKKNSKTKKTSVSKVNYLLLNPLPSYGFKDLNNEEKIKTLLFPLSELIGQKGLKRGRKRDNQNTPFIKRGDIDIPIIRITFTEMINEKYPSVSSDGNKLIFEGWHNKNSGETSVQGLYYVSLNKNYKKNILIKNSFLNLRPSFKNNSQEVYYISNSYKNKFHVNATALKGGSGTQLNLRVLCTDALNVISSNKNDIAINYFKKGKKTTSIGILSSEGTFYPEVIDGYEPSWSYKGDKIVYVNQNGVFMDLYSCQKDGSDIIQLTTHFGLCHRPSFSPDDDWIVFSAYTEQTENNDLFIIRTDGRDLTQITSVKTGDRNPTWGSDGWIYFETDRFGGNIEIAKINPKVFIDRIEKKSTPAVFIK